VPAHEPEHERHCAYFKERLRDDWEIDGLDKEGGLISMDVIWDKNKIKELIDENEYKENEIKKLRRSYNQLRLSTILYVLETRPDLICIDLNGLVITLKEPFKDLIDEDKLIQYVKCNKTQDLMRLTSYIERANDVIRKRITDSDFLPELIFIINRGV